MPLADGTNDQREDLAEPLPAEWTRESLTDVVLYGTHASPPCCKVRALLKLAGVPFRRRFGRASGAYAKFPVLFVNGRQINDSYVIFKSLAPVLFGRPYSAEDVALEELVTYGLMLSCEREAFADVECMKRWAAVAGLGSGISGFAIRHFAPLSLASKGADRLSREHPDLREPVEYMVELKRALDDRGGRFFAGEAPGALDASAYGAISVWAAGENAMPFATLALERSGLGTWYAAAGAAMPAVFEREGYWPLYT